MDILFRNITAVTMQPDQPVLTDVSVGIEGHTIAFLGDASEAASITANRIIDGAGKVLIPGLYNCHTHVPMSLLRGFANDLALEEWLFEHIFPAERKLTPSIVRTGSLLSIAEMVASGTIAFTDMYFNMDVIAQAVEETGVKANLSNAIITFDHDNYDFLKDNCYVETERVLKRYHNACDGRIKAEASIHAVYTSFDKAWLQVVDYAREQGIGLHVHLSETKTEQDNCEAAHGMTPAQVFEAHQVFDGPTVAAHCVWVTEEDMDILARRGVSVAHNPVSNLKLSSGIAPVARMLEKGINVALGTDGMASNNSHDLFEEIKLASILQKYAVNDPTVVPALQALKMATVNGAKAQGREQTSGILAVGYDADLVMLDFNSPRQTTCFDPVLNLAYSVTGRDVVMTLCRGKVLYENGEYKTIDIEKVLFDARATVKEF